MEKRRLPKGSSLLLSISPCYAAINSIIYSLSEFYQTPCHLIRTFATTAPFEKAHFHPFQNQTSPFSYVLQGYFFFSLPKSALDGGSGDGSSAPGVASELLNDLQQFI